MDMEVLTDGNLFFCYIHFSLNLPLLLNQWISNISKGDFHKLLERSMEYELYRMRTVDFVLFHFS